jgi:TPR repeat protein
MRFRELVALCMVFCLTTAQISSADAVFWQAFDLELGSNGTRDVAGAIRLYQQGVRQGHAPSMVRLGYLKQAGTGMPQDLPGAFALYKQAADTGDVEGQFMHAISHAQGAGTKKNPVLARDLLVTPAHAGHQFAQYTLGCMIAIGDGGPKRDAAARRWLDKAASGKDPAIAARAAELRDKIDKNLFAADNSGIVAVMGIAAFIVMSGVMAGGDGGAGAVGGGNYPTAGGGGSSGSVGGGRQMATPMNGNITRPMNGVDAIGLGRPVNFRTR